jgi:hypothetical protein
VSRPLSGRFKARRRLLRSRPGRTVRRSEIVCKGFNNFKRFGRSRRRFGRVVRRLGMRRFGRRFKRIMRLVKNHGRFDRRLNRPMRRTRRLVRRLIRPMERHRMLKDKLKIAIRRHGRPMRKHRVTVRRFVRPRRRTRRLGLVAETWGFRFRLVRRLGNIGMRTMRIFEKLMKGRSGRMMGVSGWLGEMRTFRRT